MLAHQFARDTVILTVWKQATYVENAQRRQGGSASDDESVAARGLHPAASVNDPTAGVIRMPIREAA